MTSRTCVEDECSKILLDTVTDNCNAVEEMALETLRSQHIPLLNTMLCLSKEDCKDILDKYHPTHNVIEQTILLIALTDFISCACANSEGFPMKSKKSKENKIVGIKFLLLSLQKSWYKLFAKLSTKDMSANQLCIVINLTKKSLERMPDRSNKMFVKGVLKMAEKSLNNLYKSKGSNISLDEEKISKEVKGLHGVSAKKTTVSVPVIEAAENKKEDNGRISKVKVSCNIMKPVFKSCENTMKKTQEERAERNLNDKRKFHEIDKAETNLGEGQNMRNISVVIDIADPPCKRPCLDDDFINGKANAFKMLMKSHKTRKRLPNSNSHIISV